MKLTTKQLLLIAGILAFVGMLFVNFDKHEDQMLFRASALGGLMVFFWFFDVIPMYVTAMIPLALGVPMGLITGDGIAGAYANKFIYLFLGGFILALAMEKWDVHKQLAQTIIGLVGRSKSRILLGFMLSTGVLSMWISNTATTIMMLPMVLAVIKNLDHEEGSRFPRFLLLSIAYSASVGGMATLVGSPPNSILAGYLSENQGITLSFAEWMKFGMPLSLGLLTLLYFYFILLLRGEKGGNEIKLEIEKKPWNKDQKRIIYFFLLIVVLWITRGFIMDYLKDHDIHFAYGDEHIAIFGAILMFILPSSAGKPLLEWSDTQKLPWGVLLLFGGGLALAKMLETNGVITEISELFESFKSVNVGVLLLIVVTLAIFGTEFMSNTAMVSVLIPVIATFAISAGISITELCIPVALSASCAFMLPIGTPPNAIVFSGTDLKIKHMVRTGFVLNVMAVLIVVAYSILFIK
ncbi:MAG: SLC13/DASS family transporter [Flavobacteriales bacterium]|nr:SLC13/DASS family transporter [Flavobacteriales bacterium]